jgi:hypothetical protein
MKLHGPSTLHLERIGEMVPLCQPPRGSSLFERVTHSQLNLALGRPRDWLATTESLLRPVTFVVAHWLEPPPIKVKMNYSRDRQLWKLSSRCAVSID